MNVGKSAVLFSLENFRLSMSQNLAENNDERIQKQVD